MLVVDHPATTYTHQALVGLVEAGATVVLCGKNHLPMGVLLPLSTNSELVWRLQEQIDAGRPLKKRLWRQIVRAKIRHQAANLPLDHPTRKLLDNLAAVVRSGDPDNIEGQAARFYWSAWLGTAAFRRDADGEDAVNGMLNYGYAIVRAAVARCLISAGLNPALGLHHHHRANPFCLADDLMEPMRPWVDAIVARRFANQTSALDRDAKRELLGLLHATVRVGKREGPLIVALHQTCASLVRCFRREETRLQLPRLAAEDSCT